MQTYVVDLHSEIFTNYRCQKAADSLDIDVKKKSKHHFKVTADLDTEYNIGLIVGASGSGKTTLAKQIFGENCFKEYLKPKEPLINQLPEEFSYDECQRILSGVGLTSVPCWIRPAFTLSNGQKARAEMALACYSNEEDATVIDEFTSVVDRTVAKVMSHSIQKFARKNNKQITLLACHYDIIDWLNPDWIIDCNKQQYKDRRLLRKSFKREEQLEFHIKEADRSSWKYYSKYHYLNEQGPVGKYHCYGLYHNNEQIGFQCFMNYVPKRKNQPFIYHSNRTVIHPDFIGFGLGIKLVEESAKHLAEKERCKIYAKFSSTPMHLSRKNNPNWRLIKIERKMTRKSVLHLTSRARVKTYTYEFMYKSGEK